MELQVQQLIQAHHYNTVGNFISFYEKFCNDGEGNVEEFFRSYCPPITAKHYTCVGLGLELLTKLKTLEPRFPGLSARLYVVSCEEMIEFVESYVSGEPPLLVAEKEHVLVALRLEIAGRPGVLVLDPGYHVARAVTVMQDMLYPHTGWFTQMDEAHCKKDYQYTLDSQGLYIKWQVQETRAGSVQSWVSLVYVGRPFLTPVDCAERRNLVYNFKSLLCRDTKGHVVSGLYFTLLPIQKGSFTLFHQGTGSLQGRCQHKLPFSYFLGDAEESREELIAECSQHLGISLRPLLVQLVTIMNDELFLSQVLSLNERINQIAADN